MSLEKVARDWCSQREYDFHKAVGGGSFKRVFHISDREGANFALKILKSSSPDERTDREVEAIQRCNHANIASIHEASTFSHDGIDRFYIVEDFLTGGSLEDKIKDGILPENEAVELAYTISTCIAHLDELSLVHRDIKPANVMFNGVEEPVLVDFGLVRDLDATSLTATWAQSGPGTPYYSAPEQLNNEKYLIDWRSDQFSLGVTLSMSIYGIHPYQTRTEAIFSNGTLERVARRNQQAPQFLEIIEDTPFEILAQMTAPWPIGRIQSPTKLVNHWKQP